MSCAELVPSQGLSSSFILGNSLHSTISKLKEQRQRFDFAYSSERYLDTPLLVTLPELGVRLMFEPSADQQLILIEVLDFEHLKLTYKGNFLNDIVLHTPSDEELTSSDFVPDVRMLKHVVPPTLKEVYNKTFGPTFPGSLHRDSSSYMLSYPGVAFKFKISPELLAEVSNIADRNAMLSKLTNWPRAADIPCTSLAIFEGEDYPSFLKRVSQKSRFDAPPQKPCPSADLVVERVDVTLETGTAEIKFHAENKRRPASIQIGKSTQQDVLRILGPPDSYFNKFDSRLSIHKHLKSSSVDGNGSVYKFHNYFNHGIDFLYNLNPPDQNGGVLEKIILHNGGIIRSLDFMRWNKCNWVVKADGENEDCQVTSEMYFNEFGAEFLENVRGNNAEPVLLNRNDSEISDYDLEFVSSEDLKSDSLENGVSGSSVSSDVKTWGQSKLYGYERCIWEVNESNNCVTSVTIY